MATYTDSRSWAGTVGPGTSYGTVTVTTGTFSVPAGRKATRWKISPITNSKISLMMTGVSTNTWYTDFTKISWTDGSGAKLKVKNTSTPGEPVSVTLTVTFETEDLPKHNVTCSVVGSGSLSASPTQAYKGQQVTLTRTAGTGYVFSKYTTSPSVTISSNKFTMPDSNVAVTATFIANGYAVSVVSEDESMGTVTGSGTYSYNSSVQITATAKPGYKFTGWTKTAGTLADASSASTTFTVPNSAATVTAHFERSQSIVGYYDGEEFKDCNVSVYDGTEWKECDVFRYDGTDWVKCSKA